MPAADARLSLLAFPQRWRNGKLRLRALVLPKGNPLDPLVVGAPLFAQASLSLDAVVIPSLDRLPDPADAVVRLAFNIPSPAALALFQELSGLFNINPAPPAASPLPAQTQIKKYLMPSYRAAFAFERPAPFCFVDHTYECALKDARIASMPPRPPPTDEVTWGQVIAFALRNPELARRLGLMFETELDFTQTNHFAQGGWLYADLNAASDYAGQAAGQPGLVARYAARIPPLSKNRSLFAAALFPVGSSPAQAGAFDPVFVEAEFYDDGFAKIVHGSQPRTGEVIDTNPRGLPVSKSVGIRLGWDDEQIVTRMNRQITASPSDPKNLAVDAPTGIAGYRVDVRRAGTIKWHSLVRVRGNLQAGTISIGLVEQELSVEAVPLQLHGQKIGDYWLPTYFSTWRGSSLVVSDPTEFELASQPAIAQNQVLQAVGADAVPLRFGEDYEFRVRLTDLAGGGPDAESDAPVNPAPAPVARIPFRRFTPPKMVTLDPETPAQPDQPVTHVSVRRPLLGYPDLVFTGFANARADLLADAPHAQAEQREPGVPDPDVTTLRIEVEVRDPASDDYLPLYATTREFPADPKAACQVYLQYKDFKDIAALTAVYPKKAEPGIGPLILPTARETRLTFTAVARADPNRDYFGAERARIGATPVLLTVRAPSVDERFLFVPQNPAAQFQAILMQPEPAPGGNVEAQLALAGRRSPASEDPAHRLARQLGLEVSSLTFHGKPERRTIYSCSAALRHTLSPDRSAITFAAMNDLVRQWIVVIRVRINRDWTWDALAPVSFAVDRDQTIRVGTIDMPPAISRAALAHPDRTGTDLVFFDAIDPKPAPGELPKELLKHYSVTPLFREPPQLKDEPLEWSVRLPVAAAPVQTPKLVSAGLASSDYIAAEDYSSTEPRERMLWLEFDAPPSDPQDRYFARVLACAPDPLLLIDDEPIPERREPPLPVDPELIRVISPGQSADDAGLDAMQPLVPAADQQRWPRHFLVPLPPRIMPESLELFGFFVYEIRLGHDASRWSTAQARFGPPLRATGVQHPPPPLACEVTRGPEAVLVSAPFATPIFDGRNLRPRKPKTQMWALLYAQVTQADGASRRNVLLARAEMQPQREPGDEFHSDLPVAFGQARFPQARISGLLASLGLARSASVSVLAAELLPEPIVDRIGDPLGTGLGQVRILRTSPLTPVPPICLG